MSLFGALFTGVSGLAAQSQSTAMIANNIANVDTVGFKSSDASFYSLVTSTSGNYSPGTVSVNRVQNVNLQGGITQTSSSTDAAISGNGFFVVKANTDSGTGFLYTRSGSFSENSTGQLVNTAGMLLYGWPLDSSGKLPSNQGDLTSLQPVDVAFLGGLTRPTTTADMSLNLNATEKDSTLTGALTGAADFTRGVTVYDSLGGSEVQTFSFTKVYGPQGTAAGTRGSLTTTSNLVTDLGMTTGNQFSLTYDGNSTPIKFSVTDSTHPAVSGTTGVSTVGDIVNAINALPGGKVTAFIGNNGELAIQRTDFTGGTANYVKLADVSGSPLESLGLSGGTYASNDLNTAVVNAESVGTVSGFTTATELTTASPGLGLAVGSTITIDKDAAGAPSTYTVAAGDTVGTLLNFLNGVPGITATLNSSGQLDVKHSNPAAASITFGGTAADLSALGLTSPTVTTTTTPSPYSNGLATDTPAYSSGGFPSISSLPGSVNYNSRGWWQVTITNPDGSTQMTGLVNFNSDGSINATKDSDGETNIKETQINWKNGSAKQNIAVDISKFTQFSGDYNVIATDQNGAALGLRTGVEIDSNGYVIAQFSNGASAKLYKVPLVTFANENGLTEESGTAYSKSQASGEENLREAGTGGAGTLTPDAVEASNVDLADEFSKLIVSQRAYTANTKVITTVDQMTQDLLQLR